MLFSDIKKILIDAKILGKLNKKKIKFITDFSKNTNQDTLFVVDKNKNFKKKYLKESISNGLKVILTNKYHKDVNITQVIVKNINDDLFKLLKSRQPFKPKKSVAITGTNGKTSTAWYLTQICKASKISTRLTGTLGYYENLKKRKETNLTTPSFIDLYQFAYSDKKNKNYFISEASSHGLDQGRYTGLNIDVAAITNLTHDHLDYHKTLNSYIKSKFLLFTKVLKNNGTAVINTRLKNYKKLLTRIKSRNIKIINFGSKDIFFEESKYLKLNIFDQKYPIKNLNLNSIQKQNLECAIACALAMNINKKKIIGSLYNLDPAPGRFKELVYKKKSSKIIIDYAHTPDALKLVLKTYSNKNLKPSVVFGCGGERDKMKRKSMGIIAQRYANRVYLTDDNPRNENPKIIRENIKKYCKKGIVIANRRKAIETAISELNKNDILIIAGKGHEKYQLIKNKKIIFDDYEVVKNFIK